MPVPKVEVGELYEYKELVLHQLGPEVNNDECLLENGYVVCTTVSIQLCRGVNAIDLTAGCIHLSFPAFS